VGRSLDRSPMRSCAILGVVFGVAIAVPASAQPTLSEINAREEKAMEAFAAGQTREALTELTAVVAARRAIGDRLGLPRALNRLGVAHRRLTDRAGGAIAAQQEALELARQINDRETVAEAISQLYHLGALGTTYANERAALDEAREHAVASGNPRTIARVGIARARVLMVTGSLDEAIYELDEALTHARRAGDAAVESELLALRTTTRVRQGHLGDALNDAISSSEVAAKAGLREQTTARFVLAQTYGHLSQSDRAAELWTEVIDGYRKLGLARGVALALEARCHEWYFLGLDDRVLEDATAAIAQLTALGEHVPPALYSRQGMSHARQGRSDLARYWLQKAEHALPGAFDFEQIQTLQQLGTAYLMLNEPKAAASAFEHMLAAGRRRKSEEDEWKAQIGLGRAALLAGNAPEAVQHLEVAASLVERLRETVPAQEIRAAYLSRRVEAHEWLVAALFAQSTAPNDHFVRDALAVAERARVRALADLVAETRVSGRAAPAPRALSPEQIASRLAPREAILEFLVGERDAFAWLITRDSISGYRLPASTEIDAAVRLMRALIASDDIDGLKTIGQRLSVDLLGPLLPRLREFRRVVIVPDGPLQRLPFAALALPSRRGWLLQHVTISTAPSGTLLALLNRSPTETVRPLMALAAANARPSVDNERDSEMVRPSALADAAREVRSAARLLEVDEAEAVVDHATERSLKQAERAWYRVIHIAAHTVVDEHLPTRSAVLLAAGDGDDGSLTTREISALGIDSNLVVLAACRTQLGRVLRGEGLLSLSRAFMESGAQAVLSSLWDVNDVETGALMRAFYAGLAGGLPPDDALRIAQLSLLRTGNTLARPSAWAGFQLTGDTRWPLFPPHRTRIWQMIVALAILVALIISTQRMLKRATGDVRKAPAASLHSTNQ